LTGAAGFSVVLPRRNSFDHRDLAAGVPILRRMTVELVDRFVAEDRGARNPGLKTSSSLEARLAQLERCRAALYRR
jgi:hypothetical protein